ncbi:MAG: DUF167 domain-containing protein [Oligoflexia bacterium]|nr:DUF167 domain-containing protein [Oligoflexia bacterium]
MSSYAKQSSEGVTLLLHLQPRAKREALVGEYNGRLKIAVKAAPVDGAANEALLSFLAKVFGLPKGRIELVAGGSSREKRILLKEITLSRVLDIISSLVSSSKT